MILGIAGRLADAAPSAGTLYAAASPWWLAGVVGATGALALAHYRALPLLVALTDVAGDDTAAIEVPEVAHLPRVSIIIPARNEERTLPTLLESLLALDYPDYEVLVVDDNSTDGTARVVEEYVRHAPGRVRLLSAPEPPVGWTGKNTACVAGARAATGRWLLFTDADTEHLPGSLRAAMTTALRLHARALSLFPQQRCLSFWERLLLPFAYQQYFVGVRPAALRAATGPALANGQYILVARDAYEQAGGHAAAAGSIIDDVALAGALKRAGTPVLVCRGERLVRVRMYASKGALVEGFTKNSFQFLGEQGVGGALVVLSTACAAGVLPALVGAVASALGAGLGQAQTLAVVGASLAYLLQVGLVLPWLRFFGVPRRYAPLVPLAALVFVLIAISSAVHVVLRRPVTWKGRAYRPNGMPPSIPEHSAAGALSPGDDSHAMPATNDREAPHAPAP